MPRNIALAAQMFLLSPSRPSLLGGGVMHQNSLCTSKTLSLMGKKNCLLKLLHLLSIKLYHTKNKSEEDNNQCLYQKNIDPNPKI
jgi:hypothetical protein